MLCFAFFFFACLFVYVLLTSDSVFFFFLPYCLIYSLNSFFFFSIACGLFLSPFFLSVSSDGTAKLACCYCFLLVFSLLFRALFVLSNTSLG